MTSTPNDDGIPELPNEADFEEPKLEDLPAEEPKNEWQDSALEQPEAADDEDEEEIL